MKKIKYNIRFFIDKNYNQVMCRVRWNHSLSQVGLVTGVLAQPEKWDQDQQSAKRNSVHIIRGKQFTASDINDRIKEYREAVETCFIFYDLQNKIPTTNELKNMVNERLGKKKMDIVRQKLSLKKLYEEFISTRGRQRNWNQLVIEKYNQAFMHLTSADPKVSVESISLDTMYKLREWYIKKGYTNRTVNKQIVMLKSFLRWINLQDGYTIPADVLNFQTNLKVLARTVTFLNYDELIAFSKFPFDNVRLEKARDQWCFMAFTMMAAV